MSRAGGCLYGFLRVYDRCCRLTEACVSHCFVPGGGCFPGGGCSQDGCCFPDGGCRCCCFPGGLSCRCLRDVIGPGYVSRCCLRMMDGACVPLRLTVRKRSGSDGLRYDWSELSWAWRPVTAPAGMRLRFSVSCSWFLFCLVLKWKVAERHPERHHPMG